MNIIDKIYKRFKESQLFQVIILAFWVYCFIFSPIVAYIAGILFCLFMVILMMRVLYSQKVSNGSKNE